MQSFFFFFCFFFYFFFFFFTLSVAIRAKLPELVREKRGLHGLVHKPPRGGQKKFKKKTKQKQKQKTNF
eukprot:NODE_874_length_737_cov_669.293605_g671_i0.p3 GENE.NODE_874_length_737_cov_669.293605_g671_i0~~NODE_874_length_737_cov_669.293605_g671_i0.p3  ORF type:complete len:69 (-),score=26.24 NODE_874_length_737_cov_669.293605_g671_i0:530-736(-)